MDDQIKQALTQLSLNSDAIVRELIKEIERTEERETYFAKQAKDSHETSMSHFQALVREWGLHCFGREIVEDRLERADRAAEEFIELMQSIDFPRERFDALLDYSYNRPKGEPKQEAGGTMVCLALLAETYNIQLQDAAWDEYARIIRMTDKIRAKHATKPTGSALPGVYPKES